MYFFLANLTIQRVYRKAEKSECNQDNRKGEKRKKKLSYNKGDSEFCKWAKGGEENDKIRCLGKPKFCGVWKRLTCAWGKKSNAKVK